MKAHVPHSILAGKCSTLSLVSLTQVVDCATMEEKAILVMKISLLKHFFVRPLHYICNIRRELTLPTFHNQLQLSLKTSMYIIC